ncbi:VIT1/CCC1 transporter family protein [Roseibacillus ishigakijimensis]|uniref:VIT1/CCC1 transporter family protein n=1 Tax=Roseibacillus ishigakijimensis TaxID=454146 RepID=A0A934VNX5_9BACT|nr:VIT1/CCC1 transporter family protein [Roseibacillus ishigakijimensis]MBK1835516.1 VIT1/CCC1 transporter family protein [Roseibacillus ishigakijimensis]
MSHHADHAAEHTPEAIQARIEQGAGQDFLKDSIYGAIDGAVTTFAIVSSVAGAGLPSGIVIIMGAANVLADGFSMAAGNFLGTRAENQAADRARREEEHEIEHHPEGEKEEIRQIFAAKGFHGETLEKIVTVITSDHDRWLETMLHEEHGISPSRPNAWKAALATFLAFLIIGIIPLLAYFVDFTRPGSLGNPFLPACLLTACSFAIIGALKARIVGQRTLYGLLETLAVGALASGLAYAIGYLLRPLAQGL